MSDIVKSKTEGEGFDAAMLQAVLQSAVAGIITIDSNGIMRSANPAVEKMLGFKAKELFGNNVSMLMPEPDSSRHDGYLSSHMETGERRILGIGREVIAQRKDGSLLPVHLSVGRFEKSGKTYFTGVLTDISAQKKAEAGLSREQAFFRSVFEAQADAIIIGDTNRNVVSINPAFTNVFGFEIGELVGRCSKCVYASEDEWVRHGRHGVGPDQSNKYVSHVVQFRRKSGETFPGATVRTVIKDGEGNAFGFLSVIRDISDDLRREAQLMQSQRMEAIGQLTGGIAHDFNNILTVILGNIELIEMRLDEGMEADLAREAREATEMGARLTDRLLTFGRRQKLETTEIDLNEFVLGMIDLLARTLGEDIDISTSLSSNLWPTLADAGQVENAVLNLAINARDAMPSGGRIAIETMNITLAEGAIPQGTNVEAGDYVLLSVIDTGVGMEKDVLSRAFEPFFTTKPVGKGSGLGLATIYGFATQSGGCVTIDSTPGRGSVVSIYLPRARLHKSVDAGPNPIAQDRGKVGDVRVLVVEDDDRVRKITSTRLIAMGYSVREAYTGADALAQLEGGLGVDVVFTDVVMPGGISGLDLARVISERFPKLKVVLTSGYSEDLMGGVSGNDAIAGVLRKPYRQEELVRVLRDAMG